MMNQIDGWMSQTNGWMNQIDGWMSQTSGFYSHPRVFKIKDTGNLKISSLDLGTVSDGDFVKTRLHFMKVSVDLFRILRLVTYFTVPFLVKSDQVYTRN